MLLFAKIETISSKCVIKKHDLFYSFRSTIVIFFLFYDNYMYGIFSGIAKIKIQYSTFQIFKNFMSLK